LAALDGFLREKGADDKASLVTRDPVRFDNVASAIVLTTYDRAGYHTPAETAAGSQHYQSMHQWWAWQYGPNTHPKEIPPTDCNLLSQNSLASMTCDEPRPGTRVTPRDTLMAFQAKVFDLKWQQRFSPNNQTASGNMHSRIDSESL
jgi:hypothetical protein